MTSFKKYFSYIFKASYLRLLILTALGAILTFTSARCTVNDVGYGFVYYNVKFNVLSVILGFLCFIVPIFELSPFKSRKRLDATMFLPVSKFKMALAHYLNGLIEVTIIHTLCVFIAFFKLLSYSNHISIGYLFAYFGLSTLLSILTYSTFLFVFYQANTVWDGVLLEALYAFALVVVVLPLYRIFSDYDGLSPIEFMITNPLSNLSSHFSYLASNKQASVFRAPQYVGLIVLIVLGVLSVFGYFYSFVKKKTEVAESISNSILSYKLLIPVYGYSLLFGFGDIFNAIFLALIIVLMLCGYMIYRRTFKIKIKDIIFIACSIIPWVLSSLIS